MITGGCHSWTCNFWASHFSWGVKFPTSCFSLGRPTGKSRSTLILDDASCLALSADFDCITPACVYNFLIIKCTCVCHIAKPGNGGHTTPPPRWVFCTVVGSCQWRTVVKLYLERYVETLFPYHECNVVSTPILCPLATRVCVCGKVSLQ